MALVGNPAAPRTSFAHARRASLVSRATPAPAASGAVEPFLVCVSNPLNIQRAEPQKLLFPKAAGGAWPSIEVYVSPPTPPPGIDLASFRHDSAKALDVPLPGELGPGGPKDAQQLQELAALEALRLAKTRQGPEDEAAAAAAAPAGPDALAVPVQAGKPGDDAGEALKEAVLSADPEVCGRPIGSPSPGKRRKSFMFRAANWSLDSLRRRESTPPRAATLVASPTETFDVSEAFPDEPTSDDASHLALPLGACLFSRSLGEEDEPLAEVNGIRPASDFVKGLGFSPREIQMLDEHFPGFLVPSIFRNGEFMVKRLVSVTWYNNIPGTTVTIVYDPRARNQWKWKDVDGCGSRDSIGMIISTVWAGEWAPKAAKQKKRKIYFKTLVKSDPRQLYNSFFLHTTRKGFAWFPELVCEWETMRMNIIAVLRKGQKIPCRTPFQKLIGRTRHSVDWLVFAK